MYENVMDADDVTMENRNSEVTDADTNVYIRPLAENYDSVDTIIKPDVLDPETPRLYFVLPSDRFIGFRYQRYLNSNHKSMTAPSYANARKISQFAMEVKLV
ncbi:hypothetical protein PHMEG_00022196 [Phytophthora megakarya]|uniref:Uncharacterized protein n=1 Tax=Phytophthora megakarya TaxID=4795 RepID=A0A225VK28_9STRA|nr:hypothetical protein PHMEG_00022196 [Phytophthora megakarya]